MREPAQMSAASSSPGPEAPLLPALRQDLTIERGGSFQDGAPSWIIHDGLRHRFFRIGETSFKLLSAWQPVPIPNFIGTVARTQNLLVSAEEIDELVKFLHANALTLEAPGSNYKAYFDQDQARKKHWLNTLVHTYMFFRVPIVRPQSFLDRTWFLAASLFTKTALAVFICLGLFSIYLVSRQWEVFTNTFLAFLTPEGIVLYLISLVILKSLHELGHAYMAKKYSVPIPVIGVAFIFLFPVLYTETSAAVRLKDKNQRLLIDCGGIIVELCVAVVATLLWIFLPDGPMRSIAFTTATLSWVLSLLVNLNPFMRFDGYYILSDFLGVENLQERSFGLAKWRMRELFFKPGEAPPEAVKPGLAKILIGYAWGTWIYRFFLFLTIALMVYHYFFKVLGIILFIVEIVWLIALPIWRELKVWWENRERYRSKRTVMSGLALIGFALVFFVPWSTRVEVPAVLKSGEEQTLYPPVSAKLVRHGFEEGKLVQKGDQLAEFASPALDAEIELSSLQKRLHEVRLSRAGSNEIDLSGIEILKRELQAENERLSGLHRKREKLTMVAPFDGMLANVDSTLHPQIWLAETTAMSMLHSHTKIQVTGYVTGTGFRRLEPGVFGKFIPDGFFGEALQVKLTRMAPVSSVNLPDEILAQTEGGLIPVIQQADTLKPVGAWFRLEMELTDEASPNTMKNVQRGLVLLDGKAESYFNRVWRQVAGVLIRESGF